MTDPWKPMCLVAKDDLAACGKDLAEVRLAVVDMSGKVPVFWLGDVELTAETVYRDTIATVTASVAGEKQRTALTTYWTDRFGAALPPAIDLRKPGTTLALALTGVLSEHLRQSQARNTRLMKELALLRRDADQSLTAFARLESFLYQTGKAERTTSLSLPDQPGQRPILLTKSREIEQRLPTESTGLCDIAFRIVETPTKGRCLTAQLELLESCRVVAEWQVKGDLLAKGWLRLSLSRALGSDAQTAVLRLIWDGAEPLKLAASFAHPDPRFRPTEEPAMLALQTWKYIPGAAPLLSAEGILASRSGLTEQWSIGIQSLRDAKGFGTDAKSLEFTDWSGGLAVRPTGSQLSAARLNAVAHPGLVHLSGGVKTEAEDGPPVEYAYALSPTASRARSAGHLPEFAPGMMSDWLRLPPGEWSELHFFLKEPLTELCDLYLLTRIAEGSKSKTPANAHFYKLLGHAGPVGKDDPNGR